MIENVINKAIETNKSTAMINQLKLYSEKLEKINDGELVKDLVSFMNVLSDNDFNGFFDVPDRIYHLSVGINQSSLKKIKRSQSKYFWNKYVEPEVLTGKHIDEGNFIHDLLLRPETIKNYYNDDDLIDWAEKAYEDKNGKKASKIRSTSIYKEQLTEIKKEGKTVIDGKLFRNLRTLKSKVLDNQFFSNLLHGALVEKGMYCICKHTGLILRGKCDAISSTGYILDFKTVDERISLDSETIGKHILNLGQHLQAPHYEAIYEQVVGKAPRGFVYGHIERRPPFESHVGCFDDGTYDKSSEEYGELLFSAKEAYEQMFENREKPIEFKLISFPHWAFN